MVWIIAIFDRTVDGLKVRAGGRQMDRWRMALGYNLVDGFGRRHWRTIVANGHLRMGGEVQNQKNKPLHLVQYFLAFLALSLESNIGFQGERAIYKFRGAVNAR
jgi:hypothetical protein